MVGRDEVVEELHVGTNWCQLHSCTGDCLKAKFPSLWATNAAAANR